MRLCLGLRILAQNPAPAGRKHRTPARLPCRPALSQKAASGANHARTSSSHRVGDRRAAQRRPASGPMRPASPGRRRRAGPGPVPPRSSVRPTPLIRSAFRAVSISRMVPSWGTSWCISADGPAERRILPKAGRQAGGGDGADPCVFPADPGRQRPPLVDPCRAQHPSFTRLVRAARPDGAGAGTRRLARRREPPARRSSAWSKR